MPAKPLKFIQHKPPKQLPKPANDDGQDEAGKLSERRFLFVHRNGGNLRRARTSFEAQAITAHIAGQHRKWRRQQRKIEFHPSVSKILARESSKEDAKWTTDMATAKICDSCLHGKLRYIVPDINLIISDCERCPQSLEMFKPWSSNVGESAFDPFTPTESSLTPEVKNLLYLYFQIIHPFAKFLHKDWEWYDQIPELQATPMLCYAIAAYSSAFFTGMRSGSEAVVLPPSVCDLESHSTMWSIPDWFRLQTKTLSELTKTMASRPSQHNSAQLVFHTVLFLLRFSILLADGSTARVHLQALTKISDMNSKDEKLLERETTVMKVNLISAYLHRQAIFTSDRADGTGLKVPREVQYNPEKWIDGVEWEKCQNIILGRLLTWSTNIPNESLEQCVSKRLFGAEHNARCLQLSTLKTVNDCYQMALYLWTYLTAINFETSLPNIRKRLSDLRDRLESLDLPYIWKMVPRSLFNIFFAGAFASRSFTEREWFLEHLTNGVVQVRYMHELFGVLSSFTDPGHTRPALLEELLLEIVERAGNERTTPSTSEDLYLGSLPPRGHVPLSHSPDLSTPIAHVTD